MNQKRTKINCKNPDCIKKIYKYSNGKSGYCCKCAWKLTDWGKNIGQSLKGRKVSEKTRDKIRKTLKDKLLRGEIVVPSRKGVKLTDEQRKKLCGKIHRNKGLSKYDKKECVLCGVKFSNNNGKRKFCSKECFIKSVWKGGSDRKNRNIRKGKEFKKWRIKVFERDNYTCISCKKRGVELHPHHIKSFADYSELRFNVSNGITLCKECHNTIHCYS